MRKTDVKTRFSSLVDSGVRPMVEVNDQLTRNTHERSVHRHDSAP